MIQEMAVLRSMFILSILSIILSSQMVCAGESANDSASGGEAVLQQMFAVPQEQSGSVLTENGVVLKKVALDGLLTVALIPEEVPRAIGPGILDVFYAEGWTQLTDADRVSSAQPDLVCDLATGDAQIIVGCKINGSVEVNGKLLYLPKSSAAVTVPGLDEENRLSKSYAFFDKEVLDALNEQIVDVLTASTEKIEKAKIKLTSAE
jgi:hypothetical protein